MMMKVKNNRLFPFSSCKLFFFYQIILINLNNYNFVVNAQKFLSNLHRVENKRKDALNIERIQNVDFVTFREEADTRIDHDNNNDTNNSTNADTNSVRKIPVFHFAMMMPFSSRNVDSVRVPLSNGVFQGMVAVLLAAEHLNSGNGIVVKEVTGLNESCPLKFSTEIYDSAHDPAVAVEQIISMLSPSTGLQLPSAFLGAGRSAVSMPTSTITGLQQIVQVSPISTSAQLDDKSLFPLFGRTVPSDDGTAIPAILFLRYELGVKHLAVLHVSDAYGSGYALGLKLAAAEYAPDMEVVSFDFPYLVTTDIVTNTIKKIKDTEFRYIFGIIFDSVHFQPFMTEAYKQKIAGTGYHNWMFADGVYTATFDNPFVRNSPLHLASKGSSRIAAVGGVSGLEVYERFLTEMKNLNNQYDIAYIQNKYPKYSNEPNYTPPINIAEDPYFFDKSGNDHATFLYDAVIALGLSACKCISDATSSNSISKPYFDGQQLFTVFKNITFDGVTGTNVFDSETGTRVTSSARFMIQNFVEDHAKEPNNNNASNGDMIHFKTIETNIFIDGKWELRDNGNNETTKMSFNDGTTIPAPDLPIVEINNNYIGKSLRIGILVMSSIIIILSLSFGLWTFLYRRSHVVKVSQPIFLYFISFGCLLMGITLIFLSIDDEIIDGTEQRQQEVLNLKCTSIPWFFSLGFVISFSSLFTKINRIYQIFKDKTKSSNVKRVKVTVLDVIKPLLLLSTVTVLILSIWTIISPPIWKREVSAYDRFYRPTETIGSCIFFSNEDNNSDAAASVACSVCICIIMFTVLGISLYEAYRTRDISTEFAESDYIFLILIASLLVSFMGIPIVFLVSSGGGGSSNSNISSTTGGDPKQYAFTTSGIIFVVCIAILLLIFIPKIICLHISKKTNLSKSDFFHVTGIIMNDTDNDYNDPTATTFNNNNNNLHHPSSFDVNNYDDDGGMIIIQTSKQVEEFTEQVKLLRKEHKLLLKQLEREKQQGYYSSNEIGKELPSLPLVSFSAGTNNNGSNNNNHEITEE